MAAQFQFVVRSGPNAGKAYPLDGAELTVGRDASNPVSINDGEVSRKHAKLTWKGAGYVLEDLGSTNGTFVNGTRLSSPLALKPGDAVSFGENIVLIYEAAYDPNATMAGSAKAARTAPAVQQAAPAPAPAPAYSGQVPAGPPPAATPPGKRKFPVWLIIVIILLVIVCACVAFFVIIDQMKLWCQVLPFLVPYLGGTC
jgi:pilus assembly protein CpaF